MKVDDVFPFRVVSGFRPGRGLHVGHFGGVVRDLKRAQYVRDGAAFVFIADHHSRSDWENQAGGDPRDSIEVARQLIACGLDPSFCTLYLQSSVPELLEVMWLLAGLVADGRLRQNHVYKQYASPTAGIYLYPLLMASDIISTRATHVAIGRDQRQHLELARDLTRRLLKRFGPDICPLPEYANPEPVLIRGINAPADEPVKMAAENRNDIPIFADEDVVRERIDHILTQSVSWGSALPMDGCNILHYAEFVGRETDVAVLRQHYSSGTFGYKDAKKFLAELFFEHFGAARKLYEELDETQIREVLRNGSAIARDQVSAFAECLRREMRIVI